MAYNLILQDTDATPQEINDFFLYDKELCALGLPDDGLAELYYEGSYTPQPGPTFKGVLADEELICLVVFSEFTEVSLNCHFYIKTKYQNQGYALAVQKLLYSYFLEHYPNIKKIITSTPAPCKHVHRSCERFGMKLEGRITNSVYWRWELVDLLFYSIDLVPLSSTESEVD